MEAAPPLLTLDAAVRHAAQAPTAATRAQRRFDVAECMLVEGSEVRERALRCLAALERAADGEPKGGGGGGGGGGGADSADLRAECVGALRAAAEHINRTAMELALLYRASLRFVSVASVAETRARAAAAAEAAPPPTGCALDEHVFSVCEPLPAGRPPACAAAAEQDARPVLERAPEGCWEEEEYWEEEEEEGAA